MAVAFAQSSENEDCSYFQNLQCTSGEQTNQPAEWADRSFQTYLPGSANYKDAYQGLGRVMCYNHIQYDSDRTSATVTARCRQHSSIKSIQFNWNGEGMQDSNTYKADGSLGDAPLTLEVSVNDGSDTFTITPEAVNFIW